MRRLAAAVCVVFVGAGCVKEISSEERLERELSATPSREEINEAALKQLSCQQTPEDLAQARNENRPETDRLMSYVELFESLKKKLATFEEAMSRNPDLHYQEKNQDIVAARDLCIQQVADVRVEFETYLRELVNVPTVQEIKGGSTITVARLDFNTLRQAIDALNPDDKDALHNRVNNAEKKVGPAPGGETAPATTGSGSGGRRRGK